MLSGGFTRYYGIAGVRGVAAAAANKFLNFPSEISVHPSCVRSSVHLRLRTSDIATYEEVLLAHEYDFSLPESARVIFDIGANIGMAALFFANRYPDARIISVEPERSNFEILARNVAPYPSITAVHAALWSCDGEIAVQATSGGHWAFITKEGGTGDLAPATTIPTLMRQFDIPFIDVLKVDIEGAEKEVFEACDQTSNWIDKVGWMAIELHDRFKPGCTDAVDPHMHGFAKSQRGYTTFYCHPAAQQATAV